jgi:hypothetical protein
MTWELLPTDPPYFATIGLLFRFPHVGSVMTDHVPAIRWGCGAEGRLRSWLKELPLWAISLCHVL